jgi:predicted kinase
MAVYSSSKKNFKENTMSDAQLLIVRGLPGSGKSTLAKTYTDRVHCETDQYFSLGGEYKWDASKLQTAHRWCQAKVYQALKEGKKVVVSNTFTKLWEFEPYLEMAADLKISVKVIELTGQYGNIHGVSEEHIKKMAARWEVYNG